MNENEICRALVGSGIEIRLKYDYVPSPNDDTAAYQALDFHDRTWRNLILTATGRRKMSKQLNETQTALSVLGSGRSVGGLRVRVLTLEAALNLQNAGYKLEVDQSGGSARERLGYLVSGSLDNYI